VTGPGLQVFSGAQNPSHRGVYSRPVPLAWDLILQFLADHPQPICIACLSKRTGLSVTRAFDGWRDLAVLRPDFRVRRGRCIHCAEMSDVLSRVA